MPPFFCSSPASKLCWRRSRCPPVPLHPELRRHGHFRNRDATHEFQGGQARDGSHRGHLRGGVDGHLAAGGANLSTSASNGIYNFGAGTTTTGPDRAVGFLSSGTATASGNLYAQLVNNTGASLTGLQISYNVEKYRGGSNAAGFRMQLFYSTDGSTWTSAGSNFLTSFAADANNNGFATAPGVTSPVTNQTLAVTIPNGSNFYLAWNYSVASGTTTTNAQALAIDDISILGVANTPTNPSATGTANPSTVQAGNSTLLTVAVTPGLNPASTGIGVTADLSGIGGSSTQQFFDDGTHGDVTANDNTFSFQATVPANTTSGGKTLPVSITDAQSRSASASIALTVTPLSTPPAGNGSANPNSLQAGASTLLTVSVASGTNPPSTGLAVAADLSPIGGSASQQFFDNGTNGDVTAGDNIFSFSATVTSGTTPGAKSLPVTISDAQLRTSAAADFAHRAVPARAQHRQDQPGLRRRRKLGLHLHERLHRDLQPVHGDRRYQSVVHPAGFRHGDHLEHHQSLSGQRKLHPAARPLLSGTGSAGRGRHHCPAGRGHHRAPSTWAPPPAKWRWSPTPRFSPAPAPPAAGSST